MEKKIKSSSVENQMIQIMSTTLKSIYKNKSSDEYKSMGDITKSAEYPRVEKLLAELNNIRGFNKNDAGDLKTLFLTLHRPVFKKLVVEYVTEPNERNIMFTAIYTVGYRVLIGELSRIYASTEATTKGIIYKPDKISKKNNMGKFIRSFNSSLESRIDNYIKTAYADDDTDVTQESFFDVASDVGKVILKVGKGIVYVFGKIGEFNPISYINFILMKNYDRKVGTFEYTAALYEEAKKAYDEYMKIPDAQRNKKIESKYVKNIEKYNIKMNNLKAKIEHYDQRAIEEAKDQEKSLNKPTPKNDGGTSNNSDGTNDSDNDLDW